MNAERPSDRLSPADLVTVVNAALGFLAVVLLARYWSQHPSELANGIQADELKLAGVVIGLGALCDVADGIVARATWTSRLGDHLDAAADAITFGAAPALLIAVAGFGFPSPLGTLAVAAAMTHVAAVVVRVARHAAAPHSPKDGFVGVTSPIGAIAVIGVLALELPPVLTIIGTFATSWLMIARLDYPHQTRPPVIATAIFAVFLAVAAVSDVVPLQVAAGIALLVIVALPIAVPVIAFASMGRPGPK